MRQRIIELTFDNGVSIESDVALSENIGVAREINGRDKAPPSFELLGHAGGAGEEVERGGGPGCGEDVTEDWD
jgi:hypothetical protein